MKLFQNQKLAEEDETVNGKDYGYCHVQDEREDRNPCLVFPNSLMTVNALAFTVIRATTQVCTEKPSLAALASIGRASLL